MKKKSEIMDLIAVSTYAELSEVDRAMVDKEIGKEAYGELYETVHLFQIADDTIQPQAIPLPRRNSSGSVWARILLLPIPLYMFLLFVLLSSVIMWSLSVDSSADKSEKESIEKVQKAGRSIQEGMYPDELIIEI